MDIQANHIKKVKSNATKRLNSASPKLETFVDDTISEMRSLDPTWHFGNSGQIAGYCAAGDKDPKAALAKWLENIESYVSKN